MTLLLYGFPYELTCDRPPLVQFQTLKRHQITLINTFVRCVSFLSLYVRKEKNTFIFIDLPNALKSRFVLILRLQSSPMEKTVEVAMFLKAYFKNNRKLRNNSFNNKTYLRCTSGFMGSVA